MPPSSNRHELMLLSPDQVMKLAETMDHVHQVLSGTGEVPHHASVSSAYGGDEITAMMQDSVSRINNQSCSKSGNGHILALSDQDSGSMVEKNGSSLTLPFSASSEFATQESENCSSLTPPFSASSKSAIKESENGTSLMVPSSASLEYAIKESDESSAVHDRDIEVINSISESYGCEHHHEHQEDVGSDYNDKNGETIPKHDISESGKIIKIHKRDARVFFEEISEHRKHFMFLCAGLVIQAVGFQLKSILEVFSAALVLSQNICSLASEFVNRIWELRQKVSMDYVTTSGIYLKQSWLKVKPTLTTGMKKMGSGCLTATYVLVMLSVLLIAAFFISYYIVRYYMHVPLQIRKPLHFDYTKSHPVASLDLLPPKAHSKVMNISKGTAPGSKFCATVRLVLPESDYNRQLGVFQVRADLTSSSGEVLLTTSQPCMLRFQSTISLYAKSLLMAVPLLTGAASEAQVLLLQLLEWQEERSRPTATVNVYLIPRAGRPTSIGLPELYGAEILIESNNMSTIRSWKGTFLLWVGLGFLIFGFMVSLYLARLLLFSNAGSSHSETIAADLTSKNDAQKLGALE